ncbi:MAG: FG-GAP repeat domain-containing protein [Vicinamibacterales bacterium]
MLATPIAQVSPPRPAVDITRLTLGATVWPADLNGDGRADLVGSLIGPFGQTGQLAVTLGTGSGDFWPVTAISSPRMTALVVGDFNGDGRTDILGRDDNGAPEIDSATHFFAGNGNGTFNPPVPAIAEVGGAHTQAADFDADGDLDVAQAGLMFRESLPPGSTHVMAIVSAGKGVAMQYRPTTGGASLQQPRTTTRRWPPAGSAISRWDYFEA